MKKAIITGSHGFIGTALRKYLTEHDIEPLALPRESLYLPIPELIEILFNHKPNYIIHLAAYGNMRGQTSAPQAVMANFFTTYNLLKATELLDYEAFINVGSSSMYGRKNYPMKETDNLEPMTFYAATKIGGAMLARAYAMQEDKPITTVLPFSVYGEGEALHRFIPLVCRHLVTQETMSVNRMQQHDWIYIDDLLTGIMTVVDNIQSLKGQLVNIGTGRATTNQEVTETLQTISGKELIQTTDNKLSTIDSPHWTANIHKLSTLGWHPEISLEDGLMRCWQYYKNENN